MLLIYAHLSVASIEGRFLLETISIEYSLVQVRLLLEVRFYARTAFVRENTDQRYSILLSFFNILTVTSGP